MSYMNGYKPKLPDEETVASLSKEISDNMITELFGKSMPGIHDNINKLLGKVTMNVRESDPELAEELDKISVGNGEAANIFTNYILPAYEESINEIDDNELEAMNVESNGEVVHEGTTELVEGNEGIN